MNLKTSFFNKSVIRSDFKRLWWVSAIDALLIFISFTFILIMDLTARNNINLRLGTRYITSAVYQNSMTSVFFACVIPVGLAVFLFSYLNSSKAVSCTHGFPVKREVYFASHMLSGFVLLTVPVIINVLILLLYRFDPIVASGYRISHLAIWAGIYLLYTMVAFTGTVMVSMISGNSMAAIVFTYIFAFVPALAEMFLQYFFELQLYGYHGVTTTRILNFLYITPSQFCENPMNTVKYIAFIIIFTIAALLLYKSRKSECNEEVVAFPKLRPIFVYGVAVGFGAVGYAYLNSLWNTNSIFAFIPFGIIGIFGANMLVKKSLKLKAGVKPALIFCVGVCVLNFLFAFDFTGYERKIPPTDTIASVEFDNYVNISNIYTYSNNGKSIIYETQNTAITSPEDIDNIKKLHESRIKNRTKTTEFGQYDFRFYIVYHLKNGKTVGREYVANYREDEELLKPIIETEEVRRRYFPILNDDDRMLEVINIDMHTSDGYYSETVNNTETMNKFYEALRYDTEHTAYEYFADRERQSCSIELNFVVPAKYSDGTTVAFKDLPQQTERYYVREDYYKTKELLESLNINYSEISE